VLVNNWAERAGEEGEGSYSLEAQLCWGVERGDVEGYGPRTTTGAVEVDEDRTSDEGIDRAGEQILE
jgi:hypothetical protein